MDAVVITVAALVIAVSVYHLGRMNERGLWLDAGEKTLEEIETAIDHQSQLTDLATFEAFMAHSPLRCRRVLR